MDCNSDIFDKFTIFVEFNSVPSHISLFLNFFPVGVGVVVVVVLFWRFAALLLPPCRPHSLICSFLFCDVFNNLF